MFVVLLLPCQGGVLNDGVLLGMDTLASSLNKLCSKCNLVKSVDEFNFRNRARGVRHSYCRDCGKLLTQNHYKNNKALYLKRNLASYAKRRQLVVDAKQYPCADCKVQYPYYVMDFDHLDGATKKFSLYKVHNATKRAILEEIAKCDLVCANCHRERTHQRRLRKERS